MKLGNQKILKRVLEVSLIIGLVLSTFTGKTANADQMIVMEIEDDDSKDYFCTYEDIKDYKYYLICKDDENYE